MTSTQSIDSESATPTPTTGVTRHAGYSLEAGVLARARSWIDVFGWIRLGRVLRVAGSPSLFLVVAITTAIWLPGRNFCLGGGSLLELPTIASQTLSAGIVDAPLWTSIAWLDVLQSLFVFTVFETGSMRNVWGALGVSLWSIVIWAPAAMMLLRQGALLTAGRPMQPIGDVSRWVLRRLSRAYLAAIIPVVCIVSIAWVIPIIGEVSSFFESTWLLLPFCALLVVLAIPIGMLALGSLVAVPISWAALINERDPDPLDALSRGYEYLYRRSLRLAGYLAVAMIVLVVLNYLTTLVIWYGTRLVIGPLELISHHALLAQTTAAILSCIPLLVAYAVTWSLIGGIYLLLRQDAGGQEVEDLWIESARPAAPLPELKL